MRRALRLAWRVYVCVLAACVIAASSGGCDGGVRPVETVAVA